MKKSSLRLAVFGLLLAVAAISMSSCNKGYGCPSDFSLAPIIEAPVKAILR